MHHRTMTLLLAILLFASFGAASAHAAGVAPGDGVAVAMTQETEQRAVDDNDDTRVEVQVVMLAIAAFTVLGVGTAGYVLRKKLGLVAGPPEQPSGEHH